MLISCMHTPHSLCQNSVQFMHISASTSRAQKLNWRIHCLRRIYNCSNGLLWLFWSWRENIEASDCLFTYLHTHLIDFTELKCSTFMWASNIFRREGCRTQSTYYQLHSGFQLFLEIHHPQVNPSFSICVACTKPLGYILVDTLSFIPENYNSIHFTTMDRVCF